MAAKRSPADPAATLRRLRRQLGVQGALGRPLAGDGPDEDAELIRVSHAPEEEPGDELDEPPPRRRSYPVIGPEHGGRTR